jgi:hypothetical protein
MAVSIASRMVSESRGLRFSGGLDGAADFLANSVMWPRLSRLRRARRVQGRRLLAGNIGLSRIRRHEVDCINYFDD